MYYISYIILFVPVFGNFEVQKLLYIIYCSDRLFHSVKKEDRKSCL